MADMYAVSEEQLTNIADMIRTKRDITDGISVDDMAMQIGLIESGGIETVNIPYSSSVTNAGSCIEYLETIVDPNEYAIYVKKNIGNTVRELTMFITNPNGVTMVFRYGSISALFNNVSGTTAITLPNVYTDFYKINYSI